MSRMYISRKAKELSIDGFEESALDIEEDRMLL